MAMCCFLSRILASQVITPVTVKAAAVVAVVAVVVVAAVDAVDEKRLSLLM